MRAPRRPGSGSSMRSRSPEEEGRIQARFLLRDGCSAGAGTLCETGEPAYPM